MITVMERPLYMGPSFFTCRASGYHGMGSMKRLALLFSCTATLACAADLGSVHTVYLLKMARGLDQFLANRLTTEHVFQIVTDPKLADAIFTDQIGESFQTKLDEIFPTPEIEKPGRRRRPRRPG